jgi:hypothetical protein
MRLVIVALAALAFAASAHAAHFHPGPAHGPTHKGIKCMRGKTHTCPVPHGVGLH